MTVMDDLKKMKEDAGVRATSTTCFNKVMEFMKQDPEIKALMEKLDYALPSDRSGIELTDDMYVLSYLDDGSEGCYVNVMLANTDKKTPLRQLGTLKTLYEGLSAWRFMGTLSGEITYLCNQYIWYNT